MTSEAVLGAALSLGVSLVLGGVAYGRLSARVTSLAERMSREHEEYRQDQADGRTDQRRFTKAIATLQAAIQNGADHDRDT